MNDICRSFNIFKFFWGRSQVFGHMMFLKITQKSQASTGAEVYFYQSCKSLISSLRRLSRKRHQYRCFLVGFAKCLRKHFYGAAPRDWFYKGNVVKVQFLIYCALFTKLHYLSNIFPKSINLGSLEGCYQVEHHIIPFPKWCCKKWQWVRGVARKFLEGGSRS